MWKDGNDAIRCNDAKHDQNSAIAGLDGAVCGLLHASSVIDHSCEKDDTELGLEMGR